MNTKVEDSNLTVALRIRPMSNNEVLRRATPIAHCVDNNLVVLMDPMDDNDDVLRQNRSRERQFVFDVVFDAKATQEYVYEKTCRVLIPSVIGGYNATVFAYGATGAGKTYTMLGADDHPGIMAQALTELFYEMKQRDDHVFSVTMSYLEIYNEMIRDLLNPRVGFLELREDHSGIQVAGLSEYSAKSTDQVMAILKHGNKQRTQEPTAANLTSSRSHAVLTISIRQRNHDQGLQQRIQLGKLYLIDLAGSERAANTKNRGKRMVEGAHINRSLLALGNCINALSEKSGGKYVNYRDSKLTRLLKDSLGGNCKTVMVAHISPASFHFEESRNTLVYADRAKHIKTKVRQNVVDMKMHISQYSNVIADLQDEIKRLRQKLSHQQEFDRRSVLPFPGEKLETSDEDRRLLKLKNELVSVFHDQIKLRQSLTELNAKEAGICLKMTRLQLLIKRHAMQTDYRGSHDADNEGSDRLAVFDVDQGKKELEALSRDKDRLDQQRNGLKKQLEQTNNRTAKLQKELSQLEICSEQREIMMLLARIQSLQLENVRLNSAIVHQRAELYRCDLILSLQDQRHEETEERMPSQREFIDENGFDSPHQLDYLESAYKEEIRDVKTYLLPPIKKDQSLLSIVSVDDGRHRNNNPPSTSLSPLQERRLFSTNYTKHGISKDLEDLISLNSEFSTAAGVYDMNDNRKSNASWMTPRTVGTEAGRDIGTHRTKERRKETEQPRGRYRQTEPRDERPSYYSGDRSPLTVSRMAHHNNQAASIASASVSTAPAESASLGFGQQTLKKPKAPDLDSLPEFAGHDQNSHHRPRRKGISESKIQPTTQTSQKPVRQRASLPALDYTGHRKFSIQTSLFNESDSSHAPSVMSEKAAILSRLNRHDVKGSIVATGYNDIDESIYNAHYRKMSVTPLHRKTTGLPAPSFALHH